MGNFADFVERLEEEYPEEKDISFIVGRALNEVMNYEVANAAMYNTVEFYTKNKSNINMYGLTKNKVSLLQKFVHHPEESKRLLDEECEKFENIFGEFYDELVKGNNLFKLKFKNYLNNLYEVILGNRLNLSDIEKSNFDELVMDEIQHYQPYRDQFVTAIDALHMFEKLDLCVDDLFEFFEKLASLYHPPKEMTRFSELLFDPYVYKVRELFLYFICILIKNKNINELNIFLDNEYKYDCINGPKYKDYVVFYKSIDSLDEIRNRRLELKRISVTADLMKETSHNGFFHFEEIMQADFILCVRSLFKFDSYSYWYPRTLIYRPEYTQSFELFVRSESARYKEFVNKLIGVDSKEDLKEKIEKAYESYDLNRWGNIHNSIPFYRWLNLEQK